MPQITLRIKKILDSSSQNKNAIQLLEGSKNYLQGMLFRIWMAHPTYSWADMKQSFTSHVRQLNSEISELATFYLGNIRPEVSNLLDRHQLEYTSYEVEILQVSFNKPETLELATYYYTKEYTLVQNFGNYLLLATNIDKGKSKSETFMLELNADQTIHSYTN